MPLWSKFTELFERVADDQSRVGSLREEELRLAAAALLVRAAVIDGTVAPEERRQLEAILRKRFDLDDDGACRLLQDAEAREHEAVDIYRFTRVLCSELDQDGRKRIVEMLWEVTMADGVVHEYESNLVWRSAELLGVSTRDRVTLRKAVASRVASILVLRSSAWPQGRACETKNDGRPWLPFLFVRTLEEKDLA